jgi:hypothetical protein
MLRYAVVGALAVFTLVGCGSDAPGAARPATQTDTVQPTGTTARVIEECPELPERCAAVTSGWHGSLNGLGTAFRGTPVLS